MRYFEAENGSLIWRNHGETLVITPWGENSLRVRSAMMHDVEDTRFALLEPVASAAEIRLEAEEASITNGKLTASLAIDAWRKVARITFTNQRGEVLLREIACGGALDLRARRFQSILGGDHRVQASFDGDENEKLYGMGQYQLETLNVKHCSFELAQRNSQASVPFVMSSLGYGFLWHNPAVGEAHFGANRTEWKAVSCKQLDYWITAGDTPGEISLAYARATGFVPMMPEYGLGFWQCKLRYWNQEQLLAVAREYKRRKLPVDVIVCDFFHWPKMGDYRFDPRFFPNPQAVVDELKSMGIELMVSVWPQVSLESENYEEMRQQGLLVRSEMGEQVGMRFQGDSMFYDATNPRARDYVWAKCKQNYYDYGIRVFWLDEAEPEYGVYDFENYRYAMGSNAQIGNVYPQRYAQGFYDGMTACGQDNVVNLIRCAWAGSQRYGALVWSGDIQSNWEDFRRQVCAGLSMGVAGIPWWTTDIGGFYGGDPESEAFRELLVRWFQWGAFCPVMRLHGDRVPERMVYAPDGERMQNEGADNEVWSYGEETGAILEKYLMLRETLRDYTRETMREAHEQGKPVMRPMFYEFPKDPVCAELKDQYMYGGRYLVAPVLTAGQRMRSVYLPAGASWRDMADGTTHAGGQWVSLPAPLETMPVLERVQE
ncbi:MAG: glycoside hydrolase family 31 protein [Clostridia bacterium]|nr:glycoside hydrolase family 31 protein [Clostridia bacterium]